MKKILFNDKFQLTKAVLDGRKTQTRRLATPFLHDAVNTGFSRLEIAFGRELRCWNKANDFIIYKIPYKVNEVVAVAQSYKDADVCFIPCDLRPKHNHIWGHTANMKGWTNKMFTQAEVLPHQIRITNVRLQKLQDIPEEDCLKEGVRKVVNENGIYIQYYVGQGNNAYSFENPREAFAHLINKVSRKDVWQENPYVFVYDFELVK